MPTSLFKLLAGIHPDAVQKLLAHFKALEGKRCTRRVRRGGTTPARSASAAGQLLRGRTRRISSSPPDRSSFNELYPSACVLASLAQRCRWIILNLMSSRGLEFHMGASSSHALVKASGRSRRGRTIRPVGQRQRLRILLDRRGRGRRRRPALTGIAPSRDDVRVEPAPPHRPTPRRSPRLEQSHSRIPHGSRRRRGGGGRDRRLTVTVTDHSPDKLELGGP